jgi:hypothetical protein
MGIIVLGWLALAGMVVFIAYAIVRGVMIRTRVGLGECRQVSK